jgi:ParB family chromosome partitioning protein
MQVQINDIKVKKRIRKDSGDIAALADSMKRFGQISPILITKNNDLIAGGRRLEAARTLGWSTINAVVAEIPDELSQLEYELEENLQRRNFNQAETAEAVERIFRLRNPSRFRRVIDAIVKFFKRLFRIE